MLLILLLACVELLILAPKVTTFLPYLPVGCEKDPFESNPIQYTQYLYLSMSTFFITLTALNREFSKATP